MDRGGEGEGTEEGRRGRRDRGGGGERRDKGGGAEGGVREKNGEGRGTRNHEGIELDAGEIQDIVQCVLQKRQHSMSLRMSTWRWTTA